MSWPKFTRDPDRIEKDKTSGLTLYGFDDKSEKTTDWYNKDGGIEAVTPTPFDEDE